MANDSIRSWILRSLSWHKLIPDYNLGRLSLIIPLALLITGHPYLSVEILVALAKGVRWFLFLGAVESLGFQGFKKGLSFENNPRLYQASCLEVAIRVTEIAAVHKRPRDILLAILLSGLYLILTSVSRHLSRRRLRENVLDELIPTRPAGQRMRGKLVHLAYPESSNVLAYADPSYASLCAVCDKGLRMAIARQDIGQSALDSAYHKLFLYYHHASLEELMRAVHEEGCALCRLLVAHAEYSREARKALSSLGSIWNGAIKRNGVQIFFYRKRVKVARSAMDLQVSDICFHFGRSYIWFRTMLEPADDRVPFVHSPALDSAPVHIAARKIDECIAAHLSFSSDDTTRPELPTRLIDLGDSEIPEEIRLIVTRDCDDILGCNSCSYVALSHRWGQHKPLSQLTKARLHGYRNSSLQFGSLEPTFRDAAIVTRQLGYRFLWIDCLCIVQDDPEDWRRECSRMAAVYANSVVTIAAAAAPDAYTGFLKWQNELQHEYAVCCDLMINKTKIRIHRSPDGSQIDDEEVQPASILAHRAWALQERLLSPRILYFGKYRMELECSQDVRHSHHPRRPYHERFDGEPVSDEHYKMRWLVEPPGPESTRDRDLDLSPDFGAILGCYTKCKISKVDDILPAMAGIAQKYHEWTGDEYIAGLWKRTLIEGLCWKRKLDTHFGAFIVPWWGEPVRMAEVDYLPTYRVPSWSWASLNGPIEMVQSYPKSRSQVKRLATIVDIRVNLMSNDPYGQVDGGEVTLRCLTKKHSFSLLQSALSRSPMDWMLFLMIPGLISLHRTVRSWIQPWSYYAPDRLAERIWGREVTICLMCETSYTRRSDTYRHWHAIVLGSVGSPYGNTYRRVGYIMGLGEPGDWWEDGTWEVLKIV